MISKKYLFIIIILGFIGLAWFVSAQIEREDPHIQVNTRIISSVLNADDISRIQNRDFIHDIYLDQEGEFTFIVYYTNYSSERLVKIEKAMDDLERKYSALQVPFYIRDSQGNLRRCDIGLQNVIQCPLA